MAEVTQDDRRHEGAARSDRNHHTSHGNYLRFFAMIGTSSAVMLGLMYLNTYAMPHVFWSETRFYMTFVMGAAMAVVMLAFMLGMYRNTRANVLILAGAAAVFAGALWLVRSQVTVQDESWMRAMIPHHSIAIMTSERAELSDPRVQKLAREIVHAQNREIAEIRYLLADIAENGEAGPDWPLGVPQGPVPVESLQQAIASPEIASIRPAALSQEEIERGLGSSPVCTFTRAVNADPVLATDGTGTGISKISGALVAFNAADTVAGGGILSAEGGRMTVAPGADGDGNDASLLFELTGDPALAVGFMGYWRCNG